MAESSTRRDRLRQRFVRGFGVSALSPVVTAAIQLGSVPLLLHAWGATKYGEWLLLSAVPSYLTLSDLGFGDASGSDRCMRVASNDKEGALETFQSSWVLVTLVSFVALALVSVLSRLVPWQLWLNLSGVSRTEAVETLLLLSAYVAVAQQNGVIESGFRSDGHFASGTLWILMLRLAETVAGTIVAVAGGSLTAVAGTYLGFRCFGTIAYALYLRQLSPWIHFGLSRARLNTIKKLAAPAFGFIAFPFGSALSFQGFTIVIGALLGPIAVVSFSTLRTLSRLNVQALGAMTNALWPELSRAFGSGNISLARRLHRYAWQASFGLSLLGAGVLWVAGPFIYKFWVHGKIGFNANCFHVLLLASITTVLCNASSVILISMNGHSRIAAMYVGATALSLGLAWLLIPRFGISGAAVALLVVDGLTFWPMLATALHHVQDNAREFFPALIVIRRFPQPEAGGTVGLP
jgi:O-antigen/teichoic acid export membrane protein